MGRMSKEAMEAMETTQRKRRVQLYHMQDKMRELLKISKKNLFYELTEEAAKILFYEKLKAEWGIDPEGYEPELWMTVSDRKYAENAHDWGKDLTKYWHGGTDDIEINIAQMPYEFIHENLKKEPRREVREIIDIVYPEDDENDDNLEPTKDIMKKDPLVINALSKAIDEFYEKICGHGQ